MHTGSLEGMVDIVDMVAIVVYVVMVVRRWRQMQWSERFKVVV